MNTNIAENKSLSFAESVLSLLDPDLIDEAAEHRFARPHSSAWIWAAAACLLFALAAVILFRPAGDRKQTAQLTTPDSCASPSADVRPTPAFTPVPTPDIRGKQIIYSSEVPLINGDLPVPGTCRFYGSLKEMLKDEKNRGLVFAVEITIDALDHGIDIKHEEELDRLYSEMYANDPDIILYCELYEQFVAENRGRYAEYLYEYFYPSDFAADDAAESERELELLAEKYDEAMVFPVAFSHYLDDIGQSYIWRNRREAVNRYSLKRAELEEDQRSRPDEAALIQQRYENELRRLQDLGYIIRGPERYGEGSIKGLLTFDQLVCFPASPEYAYSFMLTGETVITD